VLEWRQTTRADLLAIVDYISAAQHLRIISNKEQAERLKEKARKDWL
jgi:hypothetical protein